MSHISLSTSWGQQRASPLPSERCWPVPFSLECCSQGAISTPAFRVQVWILQIQGSRSIYNTGHSCIKSQKDVNFSFDFFEECTTCFIQGQKGIIELIVQEKTYKRQSSQYGVRSWLVVTVPWKESPLSTLSVLLCTFIQLLLQRTENILMDWNTDFPNIIFFPNGLKLPVIVNKLIIASMSILFKTNDSGTKDC